MPDGIWGSDHVSARRSAGARRSRTRRRELVLRPGSSATGRERAAPRGRCARQAFRRPESRGRRQLHGPARQRARPDRPERLGQDHDAERALRHLHADRRPDACSTGSDITALPPHERTAAASGRTFQNIRLFRSMTALENVVIGAERPGNTLAGQNRHALSRAPARRWPSWASRDAATIRSSSFSYGHQRLIEIARALAGQPDAAAAGRAGGRPQFDREGGTARPAAAHRRARASPS